MCDVHDPVHVVIDCGEVQPLPNFRKPALPYRPAEPTDQQIEEASASEFIEHSPELLALSVLDDLVPFFAIWSACYERCIMRAFRTARPAAKHLGRGCPAIVSAPPRWHQELRIATSAEDIEAGADLPLHGIFLRVARISTYLASLARIHKPAAHAQWPNELAQQVQLLERTARA